MSINSLLSHQYYICFSDQREPIPWDITQFVRPDCIYWGKVFETVDQSLEVSGLTFYLTWNTRSLPSYGQNIVAVILGDEKDCIPTYFHKVKAVFKCYGTTPILGFDLFSKPSPLKLLTLLHFLRNWMSNLPGLLNYKFQKLKSLYSKSGKLPPIYELPLGYYNQLDLPIKDLEKRPYDVFFAGSILHGLSFKTPLANPKGLSRKQMVTNLQAFKENHPDFNIELDITSGFISANSIKKPDMENYSEKMMNTKICLVPRGASFETFRFFEGLRYGCIVIAEALPSRWFYDGSPAIRVKDWSELGEVLEKLLSNQSLLQEKHQESLSWWQTKCSEAAVGTYIADKINALT